MGQFINLTIGNETTQAWLSLPSRPNGRGIVLGMSVWGLNADLCSWADFMADLGYAVIAPNLFWRNAPDHAVDYDFSRLEDVGVIMNQQNDEQGVEDLACAAAALKDLAGCDRLGLAGWCYGGRIACLSALNDLFCAVVAFYPTILETRLDIVDHLKAPLSIHLPEIERFATRDDAIERIVAAFADRADVETFVYEGATHGFGFSPPHPNHHPAAARLSNTRAALFFDRHLNGGRR